MLSEMERTLLESSTDNTGRLACSRGWDHHQSICCARAPGYHLSTHHPTTLLRWNYSAHFIEEETETQGQ